MTAALDWSIIVPMRTIDLSAGDEQRLSVLVAGWPQSKKELYAGALESIDGVTTVTSAGGGTSFYVYFDPDVVHVDELERTVHDIGQAVRSDATGGLTADSDIETADSEVLTFDGEPLTFDGEPLTFPVNRSSIEYDRTRPTEDVGGRLPDTGETRQFQTTCRIDTPVEVDYYRNGGILHTVLRNLVKNGA